MSLQKTVRGLMSLTAVVGLGSITDVSCAQANWSAARVWDEQTIAAIRLDLPRPPVHARNLYHVSAAMWDAWAAYDTHADQVFHHERATSNNIEVDRATTISFAAYRLIRYRYSKANGAATTLAALDAQFAAMGYDATNTDQTSNTPAALGNRIFQTIHDFGLTDGSNEANNYAPNNGYAPENLPLILAFPGTTMENPNHWQPLAFAYQVTQNGIVLGASVQAFVAPHWAGVTPFAITRNDPTKPYLQPAPPPVLGGATDGLFKSDFETVIQYSSTLDPSEGVYFDSSPGVIQNNPLGTNDGHGYALNPVTGQPYASNIVNRGDFGRCIAEFWADGPNSETPPGHWNVIGNTVSDDPRTVFEIGGTGRLLNRLEWDVKMYLAINGAVHDASVACWGNKGATDSVRPISAIRYCCGEGQCTDPAQPAFSPQGFPLQPGLVELITAESSAPGQRHAALSKYIGQIAIYAWKGAPANPTTQYSGAGWILASDWFPYQKTTFVTPAFAAYPSGHSTYSRSSAEVLTNLTGSAFFPGGLQTWNFAANSFLKFEQGPSQNLQLQWATYYDAADQAGLSRIYGGIHIPTDDFTGRVMGSYVGKTAYAKASRYFEGRISCPGDFDGSGKVTLSDLFGFLTAWFAEQGQKGYGLPADENLDGVVNTTDLFDFLTEWFAGCNPAGPSSTPAQPAAPAPSTQPKSAPAA